MNEKFDSKRTRRDLLRLGGIALGVGVPLVTTLSAREARAAGSWGGRGGRRMGNHASNDDFEETHNSNPMPYSWRWREEQRKRREQARLYRNRYGGYNQD